MSTLAKKRLMRDFRRLQQDPQAPPAGISGAPQDNNILLWNAVIFSPDDTPRDGVEQNLQNQWSPIYVSLSLSTKPLLSRWIQRSDDDGCLDGGGGVYPAGRGAYFAGRVSYTAGSGADHGCGCAGRNGDVVADHGCRAANGGDVGSDHAAAGGNVLGLLQRLRTTLALTRLCSSSGRVTVRKFFSALGAQRFERQNVVVVCAQICSRCSSLAWFHSGGDGDGNFHVSLPNDGIVAGVSLSCRRRSLLSSVLGGFVLGFLVWFRFGKVLWKLQEPLLQGLRTSFSPVACGARLLTSISSSSLVRARFVA
ncbi:hypothetical protein Bca101_008038 [Brassica carinata]